MIGCGGSSSDDSEFGKLVLIQQAASTSLPAVVSVSFKVETDDGKPVVGLSLETNFTILENAEPISLLEGQPKVTPDPSNFVYSTLLLLDLSGSILGTSFQSLKTASVALIDQIIPENNQGNLQMKIAFFDGNQNITFLTAYLTDRQLLKNAINALTEDVSTDSSTNLYGAVVQGINEIENKINADTRVDVLAAGSLILFTDGQERSGRTTKALAQKAVDTAPNNLAIFTIGLSGEIDKETLRRFGRNGFQEANTATNLVESFENIADLTNNQANSYYIFEYCSPRRSGPNNELKIIAKQDNKEGFLIFNFSADTFKGGCKL